MFITPLDAQAAEVDARMLGALLTGVRRAFPYVEGARAEDVASAHADALFRILHTAPFGVAVQALALLFQLLSAQSAVSDRFYRRASVETMLFWQHADRGSKASKVQTVVATVQHLSDSRLCSSRTAGWDMLRVASKALHLACVLSVVMIGCSHAHVAAPQPDCW